MKKSANKMDVSDDFVLIDSFNGAVYTMEHNLKSMEIQLHRIVVPGKGFKFFYYV